MIYVAGPYETGHLLDNVSFAVAVGESVRRAGFVPLVPHLSISWALAFPGIPRDEWMRMCLVWVSKSDMVLRLPGFSPGADAEVAEALRLGIPCIEVMNEDMRLWEFHKLSEYISQVLVDGIGAINLFAEFRKENPESGPKGRVQ